MIKLLPKRAVTLEVMQAVEYYAWNRNSRISRSDVDRWGLSEEEYDQLEFYNGYLVVSVENVEIEDFKYECGDQTWYVQASVWTGDELLGDADVYSAYKDINGEWVIEWEYC